MKGSQSDSQTWLNQHLCLWGPWLCFLNKLPRFLWAKLKFESWHDIVIQFLLSPVIYLISQDFLVYILERRNLIGSAHLLMPYIMGKTVAWPPLGQQQQGRCVRNIHEATSRRDHGERQTSFQGAGKGQPYGSFNPLWWTSSSLETGRYERTCLKPNLLGALSLYIYSRPLCYLDFP